MSVKYEPEVGDGGEGEHVSGLRMHKGPLSQLRAATCKLDRRGRCIGGLRGGAARNGLSDRKSGGEAGTRFRQMLSRLRTSFVVSGVS